MLPAGDLSIAALTHRPIIPCLSRAPCCGSVRGSVGGAGGRWSLHGRLFISQARGRARVTRDVWTLDRCGHLLLSNTWLLIGTPQHGHLESRRPWPHSELPHNLHSHEALLASLRGWSSSVCDPPSLHWR